MVKTYLSATDLPQDGIYMKNNLQVYHYANNNPLIYEDSTGEAFNLVAALVGGATGALIAGLQGKDMIAGALGGAASGAFAGLTFGGSLLVQTIGVIGVGALAGSVGSITTDIVENIRGTGNHSAGQMAVDALVSALIGGATAGVLHETSIKNGFAAALKELEEEFGEKALAGFFAGSFSTLTDAEVAIFIAMFEEIMQ